MAKKEKLEDINALVNLINSKEIENRRLESEVKRFEDLLKHQGILIADKDRKLAAYADEIKDLKSNAQKLKEDKDKADARYRKLIKEVRDGNGKISQRSKDMILKSEVPDDKIDLFGDEDMFVETNL